MTDQGRSALAERLDEPHIFEDPLGPEAADDLAAAILGEHGLFIADASKHEPAVKWNDRAHIQIVCSCGASPQLHANHLCPRGLGRLRLVADCSGE